MTHDDDKTRLTSEKKTNKPGMRFKLWCVCLACIANIAVIFIINTSVYSESSSRPGNLGQQLSSLQSAKAADTRRGANSSEARSARQDAASSAVLVDWHFSAASDDSVSESGAQQKFVINTSGCRIPELTLEPSRDEDDENDDLECWRTEFLVSQRLQHGPPLIESDGNSLWLVRDLLPYYNVTDLSRVNCCFRPFWRSSSSQPDADNRQKFLRRCYRFNEKVDIEKEKHEFVEVKCYKKFGGDPYFKLVGKGKREYKIHREYIEEIYRDFHAFAPKKVEVEKRCSKIPFETDQVSVLILGVSSTSRLSVLRELPQLHDVLTSPPLRAVSLLGYNTLADNTFSNVMPLLTGLAEHELQNTTHKLDEYPFIWRKFAARGYRTAYGEDASWMSTFNYAKTGFVEPPTDYYLRPFVQVSEQQTGHVKVGNKSLCVGPRPAVTNVLNYAHKFVRRFSDEKSFGYFWLNTRSRKFDDQVFSSFVDSLAVSGDLNRTVLVVLSDRGAPEHADTHQNRLQENLPFAYISFPEFFRQRFPKAVLNLQMNANQRLITAFDLHETLLDLLNPAQSLSSNALRSRSLRIHPENIVHRFSFAKTNLTEEHKVRGISLFLRIPAERTCQDAGVPQQFCSCQTSQELSIHSGKCRRVAEFVVERLNTLIEPYERCARLGLKQILEARRSDAAELDNGVTDYYVTLETQPGGGVFTSRVRVQADESSARLQLVGAISRVNHLREQDSCVSNIHIKPYCFCK